MNSNFGLGQFVDFSVIDIKAVFKGLVFEYLPINFLQNQLCVVGSSSQLYRYFLLLALVCLECYGLGEVTFGLGRKCDFYLLLALLVELKDCRGDLEKAFLVGGRLICLLLEV